MFYCLSYQGNPGTVHIYYIYIYMVWEGKPSQVVPAVKNPPANAGDTKTWVQSLSQEDPLEEGMATHSSILAWRIPWTEEPGRLKSMGSQRDRHD